MKTLQVIEADDIAASVSYSELVASLKHAFALHHDVPDRLHYEIGKNWGIDARLLLMVAWGGNHYLGIKMVTLYSDNPEQGLPSLAGTYCLFDGKTGQPLALLDGSELTAYRTAATSMLAASYLARAPVKTVLILGAGNLSRYFIEAYAETMSPERILLWNRNAHKAEQMIENVSVEATELSVAYDLEKAVRQAEIISSLTSSTAPIISGAWCRAGSHIDLVGGYRPDMREADDELMARAKVFVDTYQGALQEAGDIIEPLKRGIISKQDIHAELSELVQGVTFQLGEEKNLTVFKSVGTAIEDLAVAALVYEKNKHQ